MIAFKSNWLRKLKDLILKICKLSSEIAKYKHENGNVKDLCISEDGCIFVAGYENGRVEIINMESMT